MKGENEPALSEKFEFEQREETKSLSILEFSDCKDIHARIKMKSFSDRILVHKRKPSSCRLDRKKEACSHIEI